MKIDVSKLKPYVDNIYEEDIVFDAEAYPCFPPLLEVKKTHVNLLVHNYISFFYLNT